jgi:hypothetical protein
MATEKTKANDEAQIRKLVDNWAKALRAKNIDGLMSNYARTCCCSTSRRRLNMKERMRIGKVGRSGSPRSKAPSGMRFVS